VLAASVVSLPENGFVELPAGVPEQGAAGAPPPSVSMTLTRQAVDGSAVSISAELSKVQWRWALRLLQESIS
jgi:hypothetical protein